MIRSQITNTCLLIVHVVALIQYYVYEEFNYSVLREVVVRGLVFVVVFVVVFGLSFYTLAENATGLSLIHI